MKPLNLVEAALHGLRGSYFAEVGRHRDIVRRLRAELTRALIVLLAVPVVVPCLLVLYSSLKISQMEHQLERLRSEQSFCIIGYCSPEDSSRRANGQDPVSELTYEIESEHPRKLVAMVVLGIDSLATAALCLLLAWPRIARGITFDRAVQSGRYCSTTRDPGELGSVCVDLAIRMGVQVPIRVWIDRGNFSCEAEVHDRKRSADLVVSDGLALLFDEHPEFAMAVIAHELAHVLQRDGFLVWLSESAMIRLSRIPRFVFLGVIAVTALSEAALRGPRMIVFLIGAYVAVRNAPKRVLDCRQRSELLADFGALSHVGPDAIDALDMTLTEQHTDTVIHPLKRDRVVTLRRRWRTEIDAVLRAQGLSE